jgi:predicted lipid carrier protein YhbT
VRPAFSGEIGVSPRAETAIDRLASLAAPLASRLPAFPGSALLAASLNLAFGNDQPGELEPLFEKTVALRVSDLGVRFDFAVTPQGFVASHRVSAPAVTISASLSDFLQLARRRVDPDTLFFARRLVIEGDTELGLLLKNRLDALDLSTLAGALPRPGEVMVALASALHRSPGADRSRSSNEAAGPNVPRDSIDSSA